MLTSGDLEMPAHRLSFAERGPLLVGVNNEVRALSMGVAALLGGKVSVIEAHRFLQELSYDRLHEMQPTHIRTLLERTPDQLVDHQALDEDDVLSISPLGVASVALAGSLIEDLTATDKDLECLELDSVGYEIGFGVNHHTLVGGNKNMATNPPQTPAPSIRLAVYDTLLGSHMSGVPVGKIRMGVEPLGTTQKGVRKHLEALEDDGFVVNIGPPKGIRQLAPSGRELIRRYSELVHEFIEEPETRELGLEKMQTILDIGNPRNKVPLLTKRAITSTTSSDGPVLREVNHRIGEIFGRLPAGAELTTSEVAIALDLPVSQVTSHLNRIVKNLGAEAATKINGCCRAKRNERIWTATQKKQV